MYYRREREEICEKMKQDDNFETVSLNLRIAAEGVEAATNGRTRGRTRHKESIKKLTCRQNQSASYVWNALISPLLVSLFFSIQSSHIHMHALAIDFYCQAYLCIVGDNEVIHEILLGTAEGESEGISVVAKLNKRVDLREKKLDRKKKCFVR